MQLLNNTYKLLLLGLLFGMSFATLKSQGLCPAVNCGSLNVGFEPDGDPLFCNNQVITLNNLSDAGFDRFIIDWQDGPPDTVFNYDPVTHVYNVEFDDECIEGQGFTVSFRGESFCDAGRSCASGSYDFALQNDPNASFDIPNEVCLGSSIAPVNTSCNANEYEWLFSGVCMGSSTDAFPSFDCTTLGNVSINLTARSTICGEDMTGRSVRVVDLPTANFMVSDDDGIACAGSTITFIDDSNEFTRHSWTITPGPGADSSRWQTTDTTMTNFSDTLSIIFLEVGAYTITMRGTNACETLNQSVEITIEEAPTVSVANNLAGCDQLVVNDANLDASLVGNINSVTWTITEGGVVVATRTGTTFGSYTFTQSGNVGLTVNGACGDIDRMTTVTIENTATPTIGMLGPYCSGDGSDTLRANPPGGTWTGTGIIQDSIFDPGSADIGINDLTYTPPGNNLCPNTLDVSVEVILSAQPAFTVPTFCEDSGPNQIMVSEPGGTFSGPGISSDGVFTPSVPGTFTVTYNLPVSGTNSCNVVSTFPVFVSAKPVVIPNDTVVVCLVDEIINLEELGISSVDSTGGTFSDWTIDGVNTGVSINPSSDLGAVGFYAASFSYSFGPCTADSNFVISVIDNPTLALTNTTTNACLEDISIQLTANISPGTWSGPGIDPNTGVITFSEAIVGTNTYTYSFGGTGSCAQTASQMLTIENPNNGLSAGIQMPICEGTQTIATLTGATPPGGTWDGPCILDATAGTIDLTCLTPGQTFTYTYSIETNTAASCPASAMTTFTYNARPNPTYAVDGSLCINESFTLTANQTGTGFTHGWTFGDPANGMSTGATTDYTYATGGTFNLVHTITSPEGCLADSTRVVEVTTPPNPRFTLDVREDCAPFPLSVTDLSTGDAFTVEYFVNEDTFMGPPLGVVLDSVIDDTFFVIEARATNFCGPRSFFDSVLVRPYPIARVGIEVDSSCSPFTPVINNVTIGKPDTFFWDMGINGITGTDSIPPTVTYTTPLDSISTYVITFIAGNECGMDTIQRTITVFPPNVRAFIEVDTFGCQPLQIQPLSFSTPGSNLFWEVYSPNGELIGTGDREDPNFLLDSAGRHTVILTAARCGAHKDTAFVDVLPAPEVSITHPPQVCLDAPITFTNTSPMINSGQWDFGDGTTSTDLIAEHRYDSVGTYPITFTGFSPINQCPTTVSSTVTVVSLPSASFVPTDTAGCGPFTTTFNSNINALEPFTATWNFGDDSNTSDELSPTHVYQDTSGDFTVSLVVTDGNGCVTDTNFSFIRVHPDPVSQFEFIDPSLCTRYDTLRIRNTSVGATSFDWVVNGEDFTGPSPAIPANTPGTFPVALTATNAFGCTDVFTDTYEVLASPTAALSIATDSACLGTSLNFTSTSTDTDGCLWTLGDGTGSNDCSFSHIYPDPGNYAVQLIASSNNGCPADTATDNLFVAPLPNANFFVTLPDTCGVPVNATFTNASTGGLDYDWDFGDGESSTQLNPVHPYLEAGTYDVSLVVTNQFECTASSLQELTVRGAPEANFTLDRQLACAPYRLTVNAFDTDASRFEWYVNDAVDPRVGMTLDTTLDSTGIYDITLIAIFDETCRDTLPLTAALRLEADAVADFDFVADEAPNILGDVRFINLSQNANSFYWEFGDGTTSTAIAPFHEYDINRDIEVLLAATRVYPGGLVCSDTIVKPVAPEWLTTFYVPTGISPQTGPTETRLFGAKGVGVAAYTLSVYSPWGQLVYQTSELDGDRPSGRWNGTFPDSDEYVPQGAYTWRAIYEYVDGNGGDQTGTVTVVR
ncbi:MAG: PKD domain-containing protein [Bacteroidota bacterium]